VGTSITVAQKQKKEKKKKTNKVEQISGRADFYDYILENLELTSKQKSESKGKVLHILFTVDENGKILSESVQTLPASTITDEDIITHILELVKTAPNWQLPPDNQSKSTHVLPINL